MSGVITEQNKCRQRTREETQQREDDLAGEEEFLLTGQSRKAALSWELHGENKASHGVDQGDSGREQQVLRKYAWLV